MRFLSILVLTAMMALPASAEEFAARITVMGQGQTDAAPDMATVSVGVMTHAETAAEALAENSARLAEVLAELRKAGIEARDMQTSGLSLNPRWDNSNGSYNEGAPKVTGFEARNNVTVRVRALGGLGGVLDAVVQNGANTFNGLSFGLSEPAPAMEEARRRAVADAMAKAKLYAEAAGVTLGPILSISETSDFGGPVYMEMAGAKSMAADAVPIAEGEVTLSANVTMVFAIAQ